MKKVEQSVNYGQNNSVNYGQNTSVYRQSAPGNTTVTYGNPVTRYSTSEGGVVHGNTVGGSIGGHNIIRASNYSQNNQYNNY